MTQVLSKSIKKISLQKVQLDLLPDRAIYWPSKSSLLLADLHIGKVGHFRKNNIPIPMQAAEANFLRLELLLKKWKPKKVYFLGDLFHSFHNSEWDQLVFVLAKYPKIKFILVSGNHDILDEEHYKSAGIQVVERMQLGPFMLSHHPEIHGGLYNLCGHIHPGVRLRGSGKQYLRLPCFYFGAQQGILPAFGSFTGTAKLKVKAGDRVYAVINDGIIELDLEKKKVD